jgi:hypothetical protein
LAIAGDNGRPEHATRNDLSGGEFLSKEMARTGMGQSVEELRRESERSRAALAASVDQLRDHLSKTAERVRDRVAPEHVKAEASDYISDTAQGWLNSLKQRAMDNPLQAVAAGTALAVPMLRLARGFPLPLLMISAGLALTSKTVRVRASEAAMPAMNKAGQMVNQATEGAQALVGVVRDDTASIQSHASDLASDAQSRTSDLAKDVSAAVSKTTSALNEKITDRVDRAKEGIDRVRSAANDKVSAARSAAAAAPEHTRQLVGDNAVLIGGLGIAIGAILAGALPKTKTEAKILGDANEEVKQKANEAVEAGFATLKDKALSAADAAVKSVAESGLGDHASRLTQDLAGSLKEAATDAASAAFDPSSRAPESQQP